jgi:hypothetical protein
MRKVAATSFLGQRNNFIREQPSCGLLRLVTFLTKSEPQRNPSTAFDSKMSNFFQLV